MRKQLIAIVLGVAAVTGSVACTAPVPPSTVVECAAIVGGATIRPGLVTAPKAQTYTVTESTRLTSCTSSAKPGITGGTVSGTTVTFTSLGCVTPGSAGSGGGRFRWNDGSTSTFDITAASAGATSADLTLRITGGTFSGATGSFVVTVRPTTGNCTTGVTQEEISVGRLTLRA